MKLLQETISQAGKTLGTDIVKVDMFLNHQIDIGLLNEIGKEFKRLFFETQIDKILTIEASGIGIACITAQYFQVPVLFAKKGDHRNISNEVYSSEVFSYTKGTTYQVRVAKEFLNPGERVLILDDFLANGNALLGLMDIVKQAGAVTAGIGIVIEKGFQSGGKLIREMGIPLQSLAIIDSIENGNIHFREDDC